MARPSQPKKRRRSRSDPARRAAAARREEARRQAAEERRRVEATAERRSKLIKAARRLALPAAVGIAVIVAAIFLFRPQEIGGVDRVGVSVILTDLDYELPDDTGSLPEPVCGVLAEPPTALQLYANLQSGVVILWHAPGDEAAAAALADLAAEYPNHAAVSPRPDDAAGVLATSWDRRRAYDEVGEEVGDFLRTYRARAPQSGGCPADE